MKPKMRDNFHKLQAIQAFTEKSRVRDEFSMFVSETSFTPLIVIYNSTSILKRLIWILVVLACSGWTAVQCYWLLDRFLAYPTEVKIELKAASELEFPSVTVCNLNPIRRNEINSEPFKVLAEFIEPVTSDVLFKQIMKSWTFPGECPKDKYKCSNGKCIEYTQVCDKKDNCGNNDDEDHCNVFRCPSEYFQCKSGRCLNTTWLCDTKPDCEKGEDEYPNNINCTEASITGSEDSSQSTYHAPTDTTTQFFASSQNSTTASSSSDSHNSTTVSLSANSQNSSFTTMKIAANSQNYTTSASPRYKRRADTANDQVENNNQGVSIAILDKLKFMNYDLNTEHRRELATEALYKSYVNFMKSHRQTKLRGRSNNFRKIRSANDVDRSSSPFNWTDVLSNSSFCKWEALDQSRDNVTTFYATKDDEYLASMAYSYITAKLNQSIVENAGHRKNDFIASCKFDSRFCSPANFSYLHNHKYGNCYTFNHLYEKTTQETKFPGPGHGLVLELFIDQGQYVANLAPEAGARVVIHKKGTMPFPEDEGIAVMPGQSISIGIRQVTYNRLQPPHGTCSESQMTTDYYAKYKGTTLSKLSCLKSCYQDLILETCKCAAPFYYITENVTVCNMANNVTEQCVNHLPQTVPDRYKLCDDLCPQPCSETRYELHSSQAMWPSDQYESYLLQRLKQTNALYIRVDNSQKEFAKIQIYYQDLIYQEITEQKSYESMNLISDFGGQLGLWLGLSAITIGEFCSFICSICHSLPSACRSTKTRLTKTSPVSPLQPATLEELYDDVSKLAIYDLPDIAVPAKLN
ncbi:amiloride-sensitive sodium channel subunit beta [Biomphalaria pfeifferi]|uniref:Amiloride-sensitive sodium channel subunit beta n=1 Tax=Biomphalaria pfeifferi TaxID=112525 RepID=A0AAD8B2V4_BIOPF|nr:amiloride-sensitive sodium channel subunit beta [Biomphalaria pfeifferi]